MGVVEPGHYKGAAAVKNFRPVGNEAFGFLFAAAKHEFPLPDGGGSRKRLFLIHRRDDRIFNQVFQAKPSQAV